MGRVGNPANMTTPTPTGNHGGPAMSCSPCAHPGTAKICTYRSELRPQWRLAQLELASLIKKMGGGDFFVQHIVVMTNCGHQSRFVQGTGLNCTKLSLPGPRLDLAETSSVMHFIAAFPIFFVG